MIIRIFVALLALNMVAFVVRAEAGERVIADEVIAEDVYELQEQMAGEFDDNNAQDAMSEIGSRLLSLGLVRAEHDEKRYASDPAQPDHGVALLDEGAALNLKWNF
ncbi:hypothetical protein DYI22_02645 [Marinobacter lipolyticus]|uniref:hypothetical protein n=1 Tax=Marinobacter lipolyticus TaxID=209639 RepID=UPI001BCD91F6|nr:hypothetical protein [Marinobacter lipolyticus]MBS8239394.1 hypothetical protein [Marinobacter lipolyticus]